MKKIITHFRALLATAIMLSVSLPTLAHDFEVDGIYYKITNKTKKMVQVTYKGSSYSEYSNEYSGSIAIPSSVTYSGIVYSVTTIGSFAFINCSGLNSITIPNTVTSIGDSAFSGCKGLTSITIPNSVTIIRSHAFSYCAELVSISIPNSVNSISDSSFEGCSGLKELIIEDGTKTLSMGYNFYSEPSEGVTSVGEGLFYDCPLEKLYLGRDLSYNTGFNYGYSPFYYIKALQEVTISNSVTTIGVNAFLGCSGLTSVTIPNSVISLGDGAFVGCSELTSIIVESGNSVYDSRNNCNAIIETATNSLLAGCKSSTIPNSVTSIGDYAFYYCYDLTSISIPNSVTSIGRSAFLDCSGLTSVNIPNSVTSIDDSAFYGCTGLTSVTIPNSITEIGASTFSRCTGLTSVTIPNSVTSIGYGAFEGCTGLTSVNIPNSVISLGYCAFYNTGWYNNQADGILYLDNCCLGYKGDSPTGSLSLKDGTRLIGILAFEACTGLTSVTIPNSVTEIGDFAFNYCIGLTSVKSLNTTPPTCGTCAFDRCYGALLEVPADTKGVYSTAAEWCNFTNIIEIATVEVSTQENNATFEIPTTQGAVAYTVNVYSDEAMTQLVATTNYDATGKIIPMATSLELSIDSFEDGTYYYDVVAKSETGEILSNYTGTFEIDAAGICQVEINSNAVEISRYDINGRLLNEPTKGINIVKYNDGTTKREIVNE